MGRRRVIHRGWVPRSILAIDLSPQKSRGTARRRAVSPLARVQRSVYARRIVGSWKGTILRNVFSNWVNYGVDIVVAFFLFPILVRGLGDSDYGIWTLIASLTGYLGLLDFGVRGAVIRYVARFHAETVHQRSGRVASTALAIFSTAGALALATSTFLALLVDQIFQVPVAQRTTAQYLVILGGANVAASLVSGVFGGILVGLQRFDLQSGLGVGITGLRALAIVLALKIGYGLLTLASIQLAFSVVGGLANMWLSFLIYPELRQHFGRPDWEHVRLIFSFSLYSFLIHIGARLIYYTDTLVVGMFLPVSFVTFYAIGGSLIEYSRGLLSGVSSTIAPAASALEAQRHKEPLQQLFLQSIQLVMLVAFPICVAFLTCGGTFIGLWMGPQYVESSGQVLIVLALTMLLSAAKHPAMSIVLGLGRHKPVVPVLLAEGLANLALSVALVQTMGIIGVAWGTAIPAIVLNMTFLPWYMRRVLDISPWTFALTSWIRPTVGILPYALLTYLVNHHWPAPSLPVFFLQIALALPVALLPLWYLSFDKEQRASHWQFAVSRLPMLRARHGT